MADTKAHDGDERLLVLAPTGRDGPLTCTLLERASIRCTNCNDVDDMCARVEEEGAAALLIAEEVLVAPAFARLRATLLAQEPWSDLPIVLFTGQRASLGRIPTSKLLALLGNVTLLERPLRPITMVSAARAALRARKRQYAARSELILRQRAVQQRDQFLAMLGHELRNPLSAIVIASDVLESEHPPPAHCLAIIRRQATHLSRLVDDLLDASRVTSDKITVHPVPVDIVELVRRSLEWTSIRADAEAVEIGFESPLGSLVVLGDPIRLEQVFVNLVQNATKYTPRGGRILVRVDREGDRAVVSVRDTGVGIAADMLPRVFTLFQQVESSIDRASGGLGIGLTLVRKLVELHGGTVVATSEGLGKGSEFTVSLPVADAAASTEVGGDPDVVHLDVRPRATTVVPTIARHPCHVLIVEDNADSRDLLQLVFERHGHHVDAVGDGRAGLDQALANRPDVMVIDIGLPGMNGLEVAAQVRAVLGSGVYLIALTGYGQPEDRRRALAAGFDLYLTKPVDANALVGALEKPLRMARASSM